MEIKKIKTGLMKFAWMLFGLMLFVGCLMPAVKAEAAGPAAPKIKAVKTNTSSATLKWKKVKGASGYKIYMYDSAKRTYTECASTAKTSYKVTGLDSGKTYKFKLSAYSQSGNSKTEGTLSKDFEVTTNKKVKFSGKDFTVYDAKNKSYKFSNYAGKPVVINMWATWCPPCVAELPDFNKVYKEYCGRVQFIMINIEEKEELSNVKEFIKDNKLSFPVYYDWDYLADFAYGIGYVPTTVIFDSNGEIIYYDAGMLEADDLKTLLDQAM